MYKRILKYLSKNNLAEQTLKEDADAAKRYHNQMIEEVIRRKEEQDKRLLEDKLQLEAEIRRQEEESLKKTDRDKKLEEEQLKILRDLLAPFPGVRETIVKQCVICNGTGEGKEKIGDSDFPVPCKKCGGSGEITEYVLNEPSTKEEELIVVDSVGQQMTTSPSIGDMYCDQNTKMIYMYNGNNWVEHSSSLPHPPPRPFRPVPPSGRYIRE